MSFRMVALASGVVGVMAGSVAASGPMPVASRTGGLLVADADLEKVFLVRDLNSDGDVRDLGETLVFLDANNASGVSPVANKINGIYQTADGTVYLAKSQESGVPIASVVAARDRNGDGDAQDPGEVWVFVESLSNSGGFQFGNVFGLGGDEAGAIYFTNSGSGVAGPDALYRAVDLSVPPDGDAQDPGELTLRWDIQSLLVGPTGTLGASAPSGLAVLGDHAYIVDTFPSDDRVWRVGPLSGAADVTYTPFALESTAGVRGLDWAIVTDGEGFYVNERGRSTPNGVFRMTDAPDDGNDTIETAEVATLWDDTVSPLEPGTVEAIAVGPDGQIAMVSTGTGIADAVFLLREAAPADGDFFDAGETLILAPGTADDEQTFPEEALSVVFYARPPSACRGDFNGVNGIEVADIFAFLRAWFGGEAAGDFNSDTRVEVADIFAFLRAWFAGC